MHSEQHAIICLQSIDEILEDVHLSRPQHTDLVNKIGIIKKALSELPELREELIRLQERNKELEKQLSEKLGGSK